MVDSLITEFQKRILFWYREHGRIFPWRYLTLKPWQWLVLELLLKKTKAETVEKVFKNIIFKYHSPEVVLATSDIELENDLKYLGLYKQRVIALKIITKIIIDEFNGQVPLDFNSLMSLPYVGLYVSNAILCFCQNSRRPLVDSNIARVLSRFSGLNVPSDTRMDWIWNLAEQMLPHNNWREYNFGLIDIGTLICKKKKLKCKSCCIVDICSYKDKILT